MRLTGAISGYLLSQVSIAPHNARLQQEPNMYRRGSQTTTPRSTPLYIQRSRPIRGSTACDPYSVDWRRGDSRVAFRLARAPTTKGWGTPTSNKDEIYRGKGTLRKQMYGLKLNNAQARRKSPPPPPRLKSA